jgi:hypothetical protein
MKKFMCAEDVLDKIIQQIREVLEIKKVTKQIVA